MAKLYFCFSAMNAGKSTVLLQASWNYRERGMQTILYTAQLDDRAAVGQITSRIGLSAAASTFTAKTDLFAEISAVCQGTPHHCVLVDEAQFLTEAQVWQLARVADELDIPVLCYGLRTDFQGQLFAGSAALLALADNLREIRTICHCGRKAMMVVRTDADGQVIKDGAQIEIGGNDKYVSLCRHHWREMMGGPPV